jgi:alkyl hydroperoxide reductase subunit AhpF
VRYFGIPSGYEFSALIEDILNVSRGETDLSSEVRNELSKVSQDAHIQVFVPPT